MAHLSVRIAMVLLPLFAAGAYAQEKPEKFVPPESPRITYNFNLDWRFERSAMPGETMPGFEAPGFDDSKWSVVSTPHTYNDVDSFRVLINHGSGDRGAYQGLAFYRKHFQVPADTKDKRLILEFEGMRQAGEIYLNGKFIGRSENGVTAYGVDITDAVLRDGKDNLLAVQVDNRTTYQEKATGTTYEWNTRDFNPDYGGLNRHVWLHATDKIFQTLPIYDGLQTTGIYIHSGNFSIANRTAEVTVESQLQNSSGDRATATLSGVIVDKDGMVAGKFAADALDMVNGEKSTVEATTTLTNAHFWSPDDPYLYTVYTEVTVEGKVVDVQKTTTGFRKAEFKGGAGTGGVYINDKFVYLKGFAQRSSDEWAGLGQAYPDWMHDFSAQIIRDCHGNYMRWMHVSPQKVDVDAYDRYGIVQVCPAGDKEKDATGRQWEQRLEVMRDSIVYFRNSPGIFFWEAGNNGISAEHMQQMVDLKAKWDPAGGRVMGCRTLEIPATTPIAEYYGVMIGQDPKTDALRGPTAMFRAYSAERRDRAPLIETEDFRDEAPRRVWDDYSPPYFGFQKKPADVYNWNSETFALAAADRYLAYWSNNISNKDPAHAKWSGYASIYFFDSNADGRQADSETCRVSGKVDAVRLPKEIYYTHRVMQSETPDLHILGHWTYPADTKKTIYVISNAQSVELFLNGKSIGNSGTPVNITFDANGKNPRATPTPGGFVFQFPNVAFAAGTLKAVGSNGGKAVAQQELTTAGAAAKIRLTPIVGPTGLQADGEDVALFDVEVLDAKGERCPTDDARIDFACTGPGVWRGGYNSGKLASTNNLYCNTECGINRVSVRSTLAAGKITITAKRDGLEPAEATVESKAVLLKDGLSTFMPPTLARKQ